MSRYLGDYRAGATVHFKFTTNQGDGARVEPSSALEAADLLIYKDGGATPRASTSGVTITSAFNSKTGLTHVAIDLSDNADAGFYAAGSDYTVVLYADETIDNVLATAVVAHFSIDNRALLRPTTAQRTLDVTATGAAGVDLGNVENQSTVLALSGTTIKDATDVSTLLSTVAGYVDTEVAAIKAKTDQLTFTTANKVDATIQAAGDFAQAAADKVWASATRTLTSISALATSIGAAVWDYLSASATTVGSLGKRIVDYLDVAVSSRAAAGVSITVASPVSQTRAVTVHQGSDYDSTHSESLDWTVTGKVFTGGSVLLVVRKGRDSAPILTKAGSVISATQLRVELTAANLLSTEEGTHNYQLQVTYSDGDKMIAAEGQFIVKPRFATA